MYLPNIFPVRARCIDAFRKWRFFFRSLVILQKKLPWITFAFTVLTLKKQFDFRVHQTVRNCTYFLKFKLKRYNSIKTSVSHFFLKKKTVTKIHNMNLLCSERMDRGDRAELSNTKLLWTRWPERWLQGKLVCHGCVLKRGDIHNEGLVNNSTSYKQKSQLSLSLLLISAPAGSAWALLLLHRP